MNTNRYATRDEAIAEIIDAIKAGGVTTDPEAEYDIDAIANEVIEIEPAPICETDHRYAVETHDRYRITPDTDRFWTAVQDNAR